MWLTAYESPINGLYSCDFQMQLAELEEMRYREANMTALAAIGPRKKPRLDGSSVSNLGCVQYGHEDSIIAVNGGD